MMMLGTTVVAVWAIRKNMTTSLVSAFRSPLHRAPQRRSRLSPGADTRNVTEVTSRPVDSVWSTPQCGGALSAGLCLLGAK